MSDNNVRRPAPTTDDSDEFIPEESAASRAPARSTKTPRTPSAKRFLDVYIPVTPTSNKAMVDEDIRELVEAFRECCVEELEVTAPLVSLPSWLEHHALTDIGVVDRAHKPLIQEPS